MFRTALQQSSLSQESSGTLRLLTARLRQKHGPDGERPAKLSRRRQSQEAHTTIARTSAGCPAAQIPTSWRRALKVRLVG